MSNNTDTINVFVSHYHEDEQHIKDLKALMGDKYDMRNSSVTSEKFNRASNPDYIKSLLRPLISWAGTWVDWEIRQAEQQGKRIIGVYCLGATDADVPDALNEFADAIVGWRKDKIANAIDGDSSFENADGSSRVSVTSGRGQC